MVKLVTARESRAYGPRGARNRWEYINAGVYVFASLLLLAGFAAQLPLLAREAEAASSGWWWRSWRWRSRRRRARTTSPRTLPGSTAASGSCASTCSWGSSSLQCRRCASWDRSLASSECCYY
uniref:Uncharacterized protein n=1 Tax=Ananas comosus var. bracteatus TaxID=296719 RepID=A0A6V7PU97_ANACO|nr:unnamed protein product [Ananas comosus var. bracteatus]